MKDIVSSPEEEYHLDENYGDMNLLLSSNDIAKNGSFRNDKSLISS